MKKIFFLFCIAFAINSFSQNRLVVIKKGGIFLKNKNKLTFRAIHATLDGEDGKIIAMGKGEGTFPPEVLVINKRFYKLYLTGEDLILKHLKRDITAYDTVIDHYHYKWEEAKLVKKGNKSDTNYKLQINRIRKRKYILSGGH